MVRKRKIKIKQAGTQRLFEVIFMKIKFWKWTSYAWTVVVDLITIGIIFAIYESVYRDFEVIVVSLLILVYLSFESFPLFYTKTTTETTLALGAEFRRIRQLLKNAPNEHEMEEIQEVEKKVNEAMIV